jgi:Protein of unknown function (DUF3232)
MSDINYFRNLLNFDPKTGSPLSPEGDDHKKAEKIKDDLERDKKYKDVFRHFKNIINSINNIKLSKDFVDDKEQMIILEEKKEKMKGLIVSVLNKINEYLDSIYQIAKFKKRDKNKMEQEDYLSEFKRLDQTRTIKHDALISEINILNRFISFNFGKLEQEVIEEWEDKEEVQGRSVLYAKRIGLPKNIICPDYINMEDRKQIRDWAIKISESMTDLKNLCEKSTND